MSAEGRAKRGASGISKAAWSPFRLNGWAPNWEARKRGAYRVGAAKDGGSTMARGVLGGVLAQKLGFDMPLNERSAGIYNAAMDKAPVVAGVVDGDVA